MKKLARLYTKKIEDGSQMDLKRKNSLVCPRCGASLYHEVTHLGAIRHSCSNSSCSYEIYGVITDGSCPECNSLKNEMIKEKGAKNGIKKKC